MWPSDLKHWFGAWAMVWGLGHIIIGYILGLYWENGQQNGNYHNGVINGYRGYVGTENEITSGQKIDDRVFP